jgi:hypothetical protein
VSFLEAKKMNHGIETCAFSSQIFNSLSLEISRYQIPSHETTGLEMNPLVNAGKENLGWELLNDLISSFLKLFDPSKKLPQ